MIKHSKIKCNKYKVGILVLILFFSSCSVNELIVENESLIMDQEVIDINSYEEDNEATAFKTGFIKDKNGITYIDDSLRRVAKKCIKKIDGIEYLFDYNGYLSKGSIVDDVSYPMDYPINNYYSRLADENGIYISDEGVYEINGKIYYVDYKGEVISVSESQIIVCNGKFYKRDDADSNTYGYELIEIDKEELYNIYSYVNSNDAILKINSKTLWPNDYKDLNKENLVEELINKYDLINRNKYVYISPAVIKDLSEEKTGFHNVEYNDYRKKV